MMNMIKCGKRNEQEQVCAKTDINIKNQPKLIMCMK